VRIIRIVVPSIFLVFAGTIQAQNCSVRAIPVSFGSYDTSVASALDANGDIYVTCDANVPYNVLLDPGVNSGGGFIPRKMLFSGGGHTLSYNLYRDAHRYGGTVLIVPTSK
jgi:spore coat protein U-like protein